MTRNYTALISEELAEKLRDAGFPQQLPCALTITDYAHVFDWLMEMGYIIMVVPSISPDEYKVGDTIPSWVAYVNGEEVIYPQLSWTKAAKEVIKRTLEILEERK
jgi:hypothetical protein